jgi:hypothetical protein
VVIKAAPTLECKKEKERWAPNKLAPKFIGTVVP